MLARKSFGGGAMMSTMEKSHFGNFWLLCCSGSDAQNFVQIPLDAQARFKASFTLQNTPRHVPAVCNSFVPLEQRIFKLR